MKNRMISAPDDARERKRVGRRIIMSKQEGFKHTYLVNIVLCLQCSLNCQYFKTLSSNHYFIFF